MNIDVLDELAEDTPLPEEFDNLPTFVVGGAVRDTLMGEEPGDTDLMVAEVAPNEMRSRGFREIDSPNNDTFGVFQDSLGREVALAREEVSTGPSHTDFEVSPVGPDVPASEAVKRDLERRDFSINAMAFDLRWKVLHDHHGGQGALDKGVIRHVSEAFRDDPLRVLRGARFAARLDFEIAKETRIVMQDVASQIKDLPSERVRMELFKNFKESSEPRRFFDVLIEIDALKWALPWIDCLANVPAGPEEHHEEGSASEHTMLVLEEMNELRPNDELALLMALVHDIGKAETPSDDLPSHPGHAKRGVGIVEDMSDELAFSNEQHTAAIEAAKHHMRIHDIVDWRESTVIEFVQQVDQIDRLLDLAIADARGHRPQKSFDRDIAEYRIGLARWAIDDWTGERLIEEGHEPSEMGGEEFGNLLRQRRVERMRGLER